MIEIIKVFIVYESIIILVGASGPSTDYCKVTCPGVESKHYVCERKLKCSSAPNCTELEADYAFRKGVLDALNDARNAVANGTAYGAQLLITGAKNMRALSYDMELEYLASCSINNCQDVTLKCYNSERFSVSATAHLGLTKDWVNLWKKAIENFKNEFANVESSKQIEKYEYDSDGLRERFIRLAWAETKYVGCSAVMNKDGKSSAKFLCFYAPADYKKGSPVYEIAHSPEEIASQCVDGKNKKYSALCGEIEPIPTSVMWKYFRHTKDVERSSAHQINEISFRILILLYTLIVYYF